ncbi:MAG: hypothetical protein GXY38_03760 [Planctomycetes bacterium]|jgi:5-methyltetrahydrofolate--homocysteine methyltransferase|nr:hypothetical protein [Planctomycetota bacterium]
MNFTEFASSVKVTDGAWGTEFQKLGLPAGCMPELWNWKNPEAVASVAQGYVRAGSEVIITNTFGANRIMLSSHGLAQQTAQLAEQGVQISKRAAGSDVKVFASMGPTGKVVMMGDTPVEEIFAAFREAAEALAWGGADAIVLESFQELEELRIALRAVKDATDLPVIASMTFASGPDGTCTMMGDKPSDLAAAAVSMSASAVGANCGAGPDNYVKVAGMLKEACDLPIWIKPNAGLPIVVDRKTVFPMAPAQFAAYAPALVQAGASFIGGCCGTTPEHIRQVKKILADKSAART